MREATLRLDGEFAGVELGYVEWGDPASPDIAVCVHGLTRNARDFDRLAEALAADGRRVLCVDVAGRGRSSWLIDPKGYDVAVYARHLLAFCEQLGLAGVDWIGTSMGGLIGMQAATAERTPIRRLVINDVGPFIAKAATAPIRLYLGLDLVFRTIEDLEQHLRQIHAPFGPLTDAEWRHLAEHSARRTPDGIRLHYDPAIREAFVASAPADVDLWDLWERIRCPVLVLRGGDSTLLDSLTAERMTRRGPCATLVVFPGIGHAPALMARDQIGIVRGWLAG